MLGFLINIPNHLADWLTLWMLPGCVTICLGVRTETLGGFPSCLSCLCFLYPWVKKLVKLCDWAGQDCQFTGRFAISQIGWKYARATTWAQQQPQEPRWDSSMGACGVANAPFRAMLVWLSPAQQGVSGPGTTAHTEWLLHSEHRWVIQSNEETCYENTLQQNFKQCNINLKR